MTVIAWDGKTLAADKRMGTEYPRLTTKIHCTPTGDELVGICGFMDHGLHLFQWYIQGRDPATFPTLQADEEKNSELIIIRPDRTIWSLRGAPLPFRIENETHAVGSGRDFAAAAMYLGHSAREAVEVAIALCGSCGGGIDTLELTP